jgi:putative inorganic carbon (HCO3(-)) transporter
MNFALLALFTVSYFLHFSARVPLLGDIRFDFVLGLVLLFFAFTSDAQDRLRLSVTTSRNLNKFLLYIFLSLPLVTWPGSVLRENLLMWVKVALFFVLIVCVVRSERQLKWIVIVFLACQAVRILEPLYLHVSTGYWGDKAYSTVGGINTLNRLSGAPHDVVNATQFGWVIVNTIPFMYYLLWQSNKLGKLLFLSLIPPYLYALVLSGSRSGVLAFLVTLLGIVYFSKQRARNLLVVSALILPMGAYMLLNASEDIQTRYLSLVDSTVAGADTASGRVSGLMRQVTSISNNPLFGNGLGTSYETNSNIFGGKQQLTHNLYIEIIQETGLIGFTLFMIFIVSVLKNLKEAKALLEKKGRDEKDWLHRLVSAIQVWVLMDLFYSISCFGLRSWEWYFFGGLATVSLALARKVAEEERAEAPLLQPVLS